MDHTIEPASTGRARCRGCGQAIAKGALRFGERLPNPFSDKGDMTLWFHLECGAYKRPQPMIDTLLAPLPAAELAADEAAALASAAQLGLAHRRLPRIDGAERAPSGRAKCRGCREKIAKDAWRIRLVFYEEGMFAPGGNIHVACAANYFGTADCLARVLRFSPKLSDDERGALAAALAEPR